MTKPTRDGAFKPSLSKSESKADAVSRIAMSIIEQEVVSRDAKTARLKLARLAREAAEQAPAPSKPSTGRRSVK